MQDPPNAGYLLERVAAFLRDEMMPQLSGSVAFQARVAANAVDLARREVLLTPATDAAERLRLSLLLGADGDLDTLNRLLCERIRSRAVTLQTPGLTEHLRHAMLAKLQVDQPGYAAYLRARETWGEPDTRA